MSLAEYILLFLFVAVMGAGIPGPGDASLIAAGTFRVRFRVFMLGAQATPPAA